VVELPTFDWEEAARFELGRGGLDDAVIASIIARAGSRSRAEWREFVASAMAGDSLWYYRTPPETWNELAGRSGFAIVRGGVPVAAIVIAMS
jgi:hypothetical protein